MNDTNSASIRVIDPMTDPLWNAFIRSHPDAGIFHHPAWLTLLHDQYQFETFAICLQDGDTIRGGIPFCEVRGPKRLVCLPFADYCGPLGASPADVQLLMDHVRSEAMRRGARIEVRSELRPDCGFASSKAHWLHATNIEREPKGLLKSLKLRVQRPIKKAQRGGLKTEIRRDVEAMEIFYWLHLKTRKRQGVPIQPRRYFTLFHRHIIDQKLGFISLTGNKTQYMSAGVFCGYKDKIVYKYGASDRACLDLSPNHLMLWDTMLYAKEQGFVRFDFGKTASSHSGLRHFKSGWNATESELCYSYFPIVPSGGLFDVLNRKVVERVIRHSPPFVCRIAGEALYKYFAV